MLIRLLAPLPTPRMPPAMRHRSDDDLVLEHAEVDAVRKSSDDGTARLAVDDREGERIGRRGSSKF